MSQIDIKRALLAAAVVAFGTLGSVAWSPSGGLRVSIEGAQARVGRPLTPVSVAGVARRTTRRAVVGGAAAGGEGERHERERGQAHGRDGTHRCIGTALRGRARAPSRSTSMNAAAVGDHSLRA